MATVAYEAHGTVESAPALTRRRSGSAVVKWITSTDHKTIGYM